MKSKQEMAAEVWQRLFDFIIATRAQREGVLARFNLTPNDSRALFALQGEGQTMNALSEAWACDPSNTTFVVDRLERQGLAERKPHPTDRRMKRVVLTARGRKVLGVLREGFYRPPPELLALDLPQLQALHEATQQLRAGSAEPEGK